MAKFNSAISRGRSPRTNNRELLQAYERKGIYFSPDDVVILDHPKANQSLMGMDADTPVFNINSQGVPFQFLTAYAKKPINQILMKRAYSQIGEEYQMGDFATQNVMIPVQGLVNEVQVYDDYSTSGTSDVNNTYPLRDVYRGQTVIQYGDLEVEATASAKIDIIASKRYSAAQAVAIAQNKLFFVGNVNSSGQFISKTYGILNDLGLNASLPAPNGNWSLANALNIYNDFLYAFAQLQTQMGNNVDANSRMLFATSGQAFTYINAVTTLGISVSKMIKDAFPNLEFVTAPEYLTLASGSDALGGFQLILKDAIDEGAAVDLFSYKYRSHGTIKQVSSFIEKISFGSGGCGVLAPLAIITITGL